MEKDIPLEEPSGENIELEERKSFHFPKFNFFEDKIFGSSGSYMIDKIKETDIKESYKQFSKEAVNFKRSLTYIQAETNFKIDKINSPKNVNKYKGNINKIVT